MNPLDIRENSSAVSKGLKDCYFWIPLCKFLAPSVLKRYQFLYGWSGMIIFLWQRFIKRVFLRCLMWLIVPMIYLLLIMGSYRARMFVDCLWVSWGSWTLSYWERREDPLLESLLLELRYVLQCPFFLL